MNEGIPKPVNDNRSAEAIEKYYAEWQSVCENVSSLAELLQDAAMKGKTLPPGSGLDEARNMAKMLVLNLEIQKELESLTPRTDKLR